MWPRACPAPRKSLRVESGWEAATMKRPNLNAVRGQPPRTASVVCSWPCLTAAAAHQRFSPQRPKSAGVAQARSPGRHHDIRQPLGQGQRPVPARESRSGEAATPGQPGRFRNPGSSPRRFALTDHRPPLALPQRSGKLRNSHVSLKTLLSRSPLLAIENQRAIVQNLWTTRFACGKQRKTKSQILPETAA